MDDITCKVTTFESINWESVSALAAIVAIIISIIALTVEIYRSRSARQVNLAIDFYNRFHSEEMSRKRKNATLFFIEKHEVVEGYVEWGRFSDVLDFFQVLGTFAKSGYIDTAILYNFFYYWLSNYWVACESYINYVQSSSPMTWNNAAWLYQRLLAYDKKYNKGAISNPCSKQLDAFFQWELNNLTKID